MKFFYKNLVCSKKNYSGRNNKGAITVRHKEGGCKTLYRKINFDLPFVELQDNYVVIRSEYDPNRSAFIGLVFWHSPQRSKAKRELELKLGGSVFSDLGKIANFSCG